MLGAFFDDSGTDKGSPICVMGGLLGTEQQWDYFASAWEQLLKRPLPGKPPLKQFHQTDCLYGTGEFRDYSPAERDRIQYLFRQIILETEVITIAVAVNATAWRELVIGEMEEELGTDPLGFCFFKCMERLILNGRKYRPGESISVFFDEGTREKLKSWADLYRSQTDRFPELDSITFAPVARVFPLQGADMMATGTFQFNKEWQKDRVAPKVNPHFRDFINHRYSEGLVFEYDQIAEMISRVRETLASRGRSS